MQASRLHKAYNNVEVLGAVSLQIQPGEVVSVIGPSGSGKTTLIRLLNGLEQIDNGDIKINGQPFIHLSRHGAQKLQYVEHAEHRLNIGMVFQSFNLFPHLTVLDNLLMAPRYHRLGRVEELKQQAYALLHKVGMLDHAWKYPHQLSGGQQQRVAIARALMMRPQITLFDEPTSALDPEKVNEVLQVIEALANSFSYVLTAALLGVGYGLNYSVINGLAANEAPPGLTAQVLLLFSLAYFIGIFGFPFIAGKVIADMGVRRCINMRLRLTHGICWGYLSGVLVHSTARGSRAHDNRPRLITATSLTP